MPRPKSFDESVALQGAMRCFWRQGYAGSSVKDLELATGLKTSSFYHCFESKEALFLRALDFYIEQVVELRVQRYLVVGDPLVGIEAYIRECFVAQSPAHNLGCLLINSGTELGAIQGGVQEKIAQGLRLAEWGIERALQRAQDLRLIASDVNTALRARQLGFVLSGMLATCKLATNDAWLEKSMASVAELLRD